MPTYPIIAMNALILEESIPIPVSFLILIALNILLLVGLLIFLPYATKHKILTPRQVSIALLSSLAWAVGGGIAWLLTSENWYYLYSYFQDYTGPSYLLESEEMVGILGLALIGVLSALLGFLTLYLLSRYWPQNSPPS
jgi:hypothetical protein